MLRPLVIAISYNCPDNTRCLKKLMSKSIKLASGEDNAEGFNVLKLLIRKSSSNNPIADKSVEQLEEILEIYFDYIDDALAETPYLLGERIYVADIAVYCHLSRLLIPGFGHTQKFISKYRRIVKWMKRVAGDTSGENVVFPNHLA